MKVLIVGDAHLKDRLLQNNPSIKGDAYHGLKMLGMRAVEWKPDAVVFAGDVFDGTRPSVRDVAVFRRFVDAMAARKIAVLTIAGNHDKTPDGDWCGDVCSAHNLDAQDWMAKDGSLVAGIGHCPDEVFDERLANISDKTLLVLHRSLSWLDPFAGHPFGEDDIPPRVTGVVTGHIHQSSVKLLSGGRFIASPGCIHRTAVDQPAPTWLEWETGKEPTVVMVPDARKFIRCDNVDEGIAWCGTYAGGDLLPPVVEVVADGDWAAMVEAAKMAKVILLEKAPRAKADTSIVDVEELTRPEMDERAVASRLLEDVEDKGIRARALELALMALRDAEAFKAAARQFVEAPCGT